MMKKLPILTVNHDVFLLRHGETEWNKGHRVQGQKNSDLTELGRELGREQARQQAEILAKIRPKLLWFFLTH